ncbi:MAG TPA: deoxyribodipyrimidine photo-lyase [Candidatus Limnocylindria bacterium]|nr:deoxyribodipyrimidine photo-lyase [Candidatus Limnocylindria bacterium]
MDRVRPQQRRAIAWFRRDLRVTDNRMLEAATHDADRVWPVFVADPELLERHAAATGRLAWFAANLGALDLTLTGAGSGLTVLAGEPEVVLRDFAGRIGADAVFAAADEDPMAAARDARVAARLRLRLVDDQRILPPGEIVTAAGDAYTVFTPFRRALDARVEERADLVTAAAEARLDRLARRPSDAAGPEAFVAPASPHALPEAGETAAAGRLRGFLREGITGYREERDLPGPGTTSHLSPYLRVGAISIRACWRAARNAASRARERGDARMAQGAATWRGELAWREFFAHVLAAHPRLATESFRREYDAIEWESGAAADDLLDAWRAGRTGFPLVDAGMRQLVATGWMHNRARLVTASFLVKDAGLDWRRGASVFAEHLLDADVQQNEGNWQWVAGVGTDAAPYFRIFNPTLQGKRFDPDGSYVRRWVPELAAVPDQHIHEPWRTARGPRDYPPPILDHAEARQRTLARYRAAVS